MKKLLTALLCVALAAAMSVACLASVDVGTYKDSDKEEQDYDLNVFWVDEPSEDLLPGQDYYLETHWGSSGAIDDDFFDQYTISQSIVSDTEDVSNTVFRKYVTAAEFVKGSDGEYYYHIGVSSGSKDTEDMSGGIVIYAKDREYPDERAACVIEFDIGYSSSTVTVDEDEYTLPEGGAVVEFDKDLDRCTITFDNDSTLRMKFSSVHRYNLCYGEDVNENIAKANPKAKIEQMTFYGRPKFSEALTFKFYAGDNAKYLYELGSDNTLTLLSKTNSKGYFGISTKVLGTYLVSDTELTGAAVTAASPTAETAASSVVVTDASQLPQNPSTGAKF
jgi:hypothetical protein